MDNPDYICNPWKMDLGKKLHVARKGGRRFAFIYVGDYFKIFNLNYIFFFF